MTESTCEHEPLIQAHLDGELEPVELELLEGHLPGCAVCTAAHAELGALAGRLADMYQATQQAPVHVRVPSVPAPGAAPRPAVRPSGIGLAANRIGGYKIKREIARGGMGRVYHAIQISMDRPVALKVLAPEFAANEKFVARFVREARVAAGVSHPNLVKIFEVGKAEDLLYYSMELVEGEDAEQLYKREGRVSQRRSAEIGIEIARALEAARQVGIIHRDIKPANILLTPEGGVKLADCGLAKAVDSSDGSLTMKKTVMGSPNYMSPEQAKDMRTATHRSDVYSLGATLLHLVTGEAPFGKGSAVEIIARVLRDPISVPEVVGGEALDPNMRAIILRCMEKDPEARYETAGQLAGELSNYLSGGVVQAQVGGSARVQRASKRIASKKTGRLRKGSSEGRLRTDSSGTNRLSTSGTHQARRGVPPFVFAAAAAAVVFAMGWAILSGTDSASDGNGGIVKQPAPRVSAEPEVKRQVKRVSDVQQENRPKQDPGSEPASRPSGGQPGAIEDERPATDSKAELLLAAYMDWKDENPHRLGEAFRRAHELSESLSEYPRAAERAREEKGVISDQLDELMLELDKSAQTLAADGLLAEAQSLYASFLEEHGHGVPGSSRAKLVVHTYGAEIEAQLAADSSKLEELLAASKLSAAEKLLDKIERYAGRTAADGVRAQFGEAITALASADRPADEDDKESLGGKKKKADPLDDNQVLLKQGEELLALAQTKLDEGDLDGAELALKKVATEYSRVKSLKEKLETLRDAVAKKRDADTPEWGEVLAAVFRGDVEVHEGNRITVSYDFKKKEQAGDWIASSPPSAGDWGGRGGGEARKRFEKFLADQPMPKKAPVEPWNVHRDYLLAYGQERRFFRGTFKGSEALEVKVSAKGKQNLLVAVRGSNNTLIAGLGYMVNNLALDRLVPNRRRAGDQVREALDGIDHTTKSSLKRGPSLAILSQRSLYNHKELVAKRLPLKRKKGTFTFAIRPGDDDTQLEMVVDKKTVGKKISEEFLLDKGLKGPVEVGLVTFGAVVAYTEVSITGTLSDTFVKKLRKVAAQAGNDGEKIRAALEEQDRKDAEQAKEEAEAKRKQWEEERKRRRERERNGGGDGDGEGGGDDGEKRDGDEKRDGRR